MEGRRSPDLQPNGKVAKKKILTVELHRASSDSLCQPMPSQAQSPGPESRPSQRPDTGNTTPPGRKRKAAESTEQPQDAPSPKAILRRSGRSRKPHPDSFRNNSSSGDELASSPPMGSPRKTQPSTETVRRNPRRRPAPEVFPVPDDVLEAALAPIQTAELEDWEGWIELESDPSSFNVILQDLGVKDVKIEELFSVDEGSLSVLPKPVHGLIFLYQYVEEEQDTTVDQADDVWFANQTTDNACATVALLNIIMNAQDVELGDKLKDFKATTARLSPPLRGWHLCNNKWIRMIHNSFARRLDLLNTDLSLQNKVDEAKKKRARPIAPKRGQGRSKPLSDAGFHFIAYVPVGGTVYQLDGLEKKPLAIGEYLDDWTAVASPFIETRMLQYESEQLSFNLLALCPNPLRAIRDSLAENIRSLARLGGRHPPKATETTSGGGPSPPSPSELLDNADDPRLAEYGLSKTDILTDDTIPSNVTADQGQGPAGTEKPTLPPVTNGNSITRVGAEEAPARGEEGEEALGAEQKRLRAEYARTLASELEDAQRVAGQREDYTLAIHRWVRMLADKDVLRELHEVTTAGQ